MDRHEIIKALDKAATDAFSFCPQHVKDSLYYLAAREIELLEAELSQTRMELNCEIFKSGTGKP